MEVLWMTKEMLFDEFRSYFPEKAQNVVECKKIGSRTISLRIKNEDKTKVFLFYNSDNWSFGTKIWRKIPDNIYKNKKERKF